MFILCKWGKSLNKIRVSLELNTCGYFQWIWSYIMIRYIFKWLLRMRRVPSYFNWPLSFVKPQPQWSIGTCFSSESSWSCKLFSYQIMWRQLRIRVFRQVPFRYLNTLSVAESINILHSFPNFVHLIYSPSFF